MRQTTYQQEDIRPQLIKYISEATEQIYLAIGWMNDIGLVGLLEKKALAGLAVKVILIDDTNNKKQKSVFQKMTQQGVQVIWLEKKHREILIDHKFGVVDTKYVFTGNYVWGAKNGPKEDFFTISEDIPTLAKGFIEEFEYLLLLNHMPKGETKPINSISGLLKKLEILKVLLGIGDTEFIHWRLKELDHFQEDRNVSFIYNALLSEEYEEGLELIKEFTQFHQPLRICIDPPIDNLKREIQRIEEEIASVSNEFSETQKLIHQFSKKHSENLGDLLQKILFQSKIKAAIEAKMDESKQEEYEEAKKDHEEYSKAHEVAKKQKLAVLTPQQQKELKKLYRQTSLKCHPDRVVEELHAEAEEIFVELNKAYKANDLERVKEISQQLKSGIMLSKSEGITELKKLESTVKSLTQKLEGWLEKLSNLKAQPTYKTVSSIEDWSLYFTETKDILEDQLQRLLNFNQQNEETPIASLSEKVTD